MNVTKTIDSLELLINSLPEQNNLEKLKTFAAIKLLLSMLNKIAKQDHPNSDITMYILEFNQPLESIVGLDDKTALKDQDYIWLESSIGKLRSSLGFGTS